MVVQEQYSLFLWKKQEGTGWLFPKNGIFTIGKVDKMKN